MMITESNSRTEEKIKSYEESSLFIGKLSVMNHELLKQGRHIS